jgi:hypothetical protein
MLAGIVNGERLILSQLSLEIECVLGPQIFVSFHYLNGNSEMNLHKDILYAHQDVCVSFFLSNMGNKATTRLRQANLDKHKLNEYIVLKCDKEILNTHLFLLRSMPSPGRHYLAKIIAIGWR